MMNNKWISIIGAFILTMGLTACSVSTEKADSAVNPVTTPSVKAATETLKDSINLPKEKVVKENQDPTSPVDTQQTTSNLPDSANAIDKTYTDITIAAAGDIMFHRPQLKSAYNDRTKTYDFKSVFEDVKSIISDADLAIANFETTTAGDSQPFTGYPTFNSPDEVIDAIQYAGFDVLTTANNHSLDTGSAGLKRTVEMIRSKGIENVGTYNGTPETRVLMKNVRGINIALLSYTEFVNYAGKKYPSNELATMLNLMSKDKIIEDIQEAKDLGADLIIAYMHWGNEYEENPNAKQVEFAQLMAEEGVDIILGSHPHVIQRSEYLESGGRKAFVIYSMGNFISNQRMETLSSRNQHTEDGIIVKFNIRKNNKNNETTIQKVEYVPTWVYRNKEKGQTKFAYRILPVGNFLNSSEVSEEYKTRMKRSLEETVSKMEMSPIGEY